MRYHIIRPLRTFRRKLPLIHALTLEFSSALRRHVSLTRFAHLFFCSGSGSLCRHSKESKEPWLRPLLEANETNR
jgi:hypothetical protein